jgi:hypothetical protein
VQTGPVYQTWWSEVRVEFDMRYNDDLEIYPTLPLMEWYEEGMAPRTAAERAYLEVCGR